MVKTFREAFPTLKLNNKLSGMLEDTEVERVSFAKERSLLSVFINSGHIIPKSDIFSVEDEIKRQLFPKDNVEVKCHEKFTLSDAYTAESFMETYIDSIWLEIERYSKILALMLKKANIEYPSSDRLTLKMYDVLPDKGKTDELARIIEKILTERSNLPTSVCIEYETVKKRADAWEHTELRNAEKRPYDEEEHKKFVKNMSSADVDLPFNKPESSEISTNSSMYYKSAVHDLAGTHANTGVYSGANANADVYAGAGVQANANAGAGARVNADVPARVDVPTGAGVPHATRKSKNSFNRAKKLPPNPDVVYGRDFEGENMPLKDINIEGDEVIISGQVISADKRDIRGSEETGGKSLVILAVTDFEDTISVKIFVKNEWLEDLWGAVQKGAFVTIKGVVMFDKFDKELSIGSVSCVKKSSDFRVRRMDNAKVKRTELHCHTKMSNMDGLAEVKDVIKQAYNWGHSAIAITDHGDVQAFPEAYHTWQGLFKAEKERCKKEGIEFDKDKFFKIIYGLEAYLVDDVKEIAVNVKDRLIDTKYVVFDIETTGFSAANSKIIEIGAVKIESGEIKERFSALINPEKPIPYRIEQLTGITDDMVKNEPTIEEVLPKFLEFCNDAVLVAHNANFDVGFIAEKSSQMGIVTDISYVDTMGMSRMCLKNQAKHTLDAVAKTLGVSLESHHRAEDDARACAHIFLKLADTLKKDGLLKLSELNALSADNIDVIKKLHSYHVIIMAANDIGRVNLYKLISSSHIKYYYRQPKLPKTLLMKHREGLIIGSACEAGELYQAILSDKTDAEIAQIANFYDYLEIQPRGNNAFMINSERFDSVSSEEDLEEINKRIIMVGERLSKPVVATCDVHFLNPEDAIYRSIIMSGKGFEDADNQAPLYMHTTEEMLSEFAYLGADKAREVVIENPRKISEMIENIAPVRPDKCPPIIEESDKKLTDICYKKAHETYGNLLPEVVDKRLKRELDSIISNGFAVMYIIAQKLVWKSMEDGYLVGSRGSVGSSLVATMAGITEVNPLSPHYYCAECSYSDFDSDEVRAHAGGAGCDLPSKNCPLCGKPLKKDGFDIPFETFLGFKGDKEPDIDLNFSGEYQSKAHKYTEVIFGAKQTFRAGTISTLAEKTAFGYVKKYYEERGAEKRKCELARLAEGCTGVSKTTGQHPGGIIVLPLGEDINSFTPIQHPANDSKSDVITTHFDYHSIDHNLLKLDILGHDDPTMIRMLQDLTGVDPLSIPLDDKGVMSLFKGTEALGITPEQIDGCQLGVLGIPEFGTDFVIQMLIDTKPATFSDLVRISGLSHGTDVWLGNAQTMIEEGKTTLSGAICTRDDIMIYLISKGVGESMSFNIMESVRKGKGLKDEWEQAMLDNDVPEWYIWSCKKIAYMFPKAHAAAYVMMAFRIAWYKINYPQAYYASYFSIRSDGFSYEAFCRGEKHLRQRIGEIKSLPQKATAKEETMLKDMRIAQEMYARGISFRHIDINTASANNFKIAVDGIMPSFKSIDGMGDKAAELMEAAARDGAYMSKEDFKNRTKASQNVMDIMEGFGLFGELRNSNQMSLFDLA